MEFVEGDVGCMYIDFDFVVLCWIVWWLFLSSVLCCCLFWSLLIL